MSLQGLDQGKAHFTSAPAESFNRNLDFYTITVAGQTFRSDGSTGLDSTGVPNDAEQYLFNKMIEVIEQKAQPIVLTGGTTGSTVFNFIVEHPTLWKEAGATDPKATNLKDDLENAILALEDDSNAQLYAGFVATVAWSATLS